jgi:hypothetical protein
MDDVELDFRIMGLKNGEQELRKEQNGHHREGSQGQTYRALVLKKKKQKKKKISRRTN